MIMFPPAVKIYVSVKPTDMRRSFDGLSLLAENEMSKDPLSGHLFVFFNRTRDMAKVLWWDQGGYSLYSRRLERGRFQIGEWNRASGHVEMSCVELSLILEGIDLRNAKRRKNWVRVNEVNAI